MFDNNWFGIWFSVPLFFIFLYRFGIGFHFLSKMTSVCSIPSLQLRSSLKTKIIPLMPWSWKFIPEWFFFDSFIIPISHHEGNQVPKYAKWYRCRTHTRAWGRRWILFPNKVGVRTVARDFAHEKWNVLGCPKSEKCITLVRALKFVQSWSLCCYNCFGSTDEWNASLCSCFSWLGKSGTFV